MKTFLHYCAEDIHNKYADSLNELCIVFPNNRARLFFVEALYQEAGKAIWAPEFSSISELFSRHCPLEQADPLLLNSLLYRIYQNQGLEGESFDEFYPWGLILLKDFDNIDKNLADARQLFRNIKELAEYGDDFDYLSTDQIEAIKRLFAHFDTDRTELKKRFVRIWNQLFNIYTQFREELILQNIAYEGMIQRWVVEHFDEKQPFEAKHYLFVGFNALSACEKVLFNNLKKSGKALFYWDYDQYYLSRPLHEAGHFIRENLLHFPNELHKSCFDNWTSRPKKIQFIAAPTEHAQVHYASHWIEHNITDPYTEAGQKYSARDSAIILCNENLLPGLLQCIPPHVQELNVTMGYPVKQTAVFNLLRQLLLLHSDNGGKKQFRSRYVLPVLQNPYIRQLSEAAKTLEKELRTQNRLYPESGELQQDALLSLIFSPVQTALEMGTMLLELFTGLGRTIGNNPENSEDSEISAGDNSSPDILKENQALFLPLFQEALFKSYTQVNRLNGLIKKGLLDINIQTYKKLLLHVLELSVPFSGEPLNGMQIMGLLETRCLDFKNILMLSVNEGQLPKNRAETSFIPYNLRKAFNLSGPEHQDAISAYYFFRALQRAEHITLLYNSSTEGLNRGEMSRFMLQLSMESGLPVESLNLGTEIKALNTTPISIHKTPELMEQLYGMYDHSGAETTIRRRYLSPSMLNNYLNCSLKYYFQYVLGLKKEEELSEQIDPLSFGNIFHRSAQYLYVGLILQKNGRKAQHEDILELMDNMRAFNRALSNQEQSEERLSGNIEAADLETLSGNKAYIGGIVDYFMGIEFFRLKSGQEPPTYNGEQLIQRKLLTQFLQFLLRLDKNYAPFDLLGLENAVDEYLEIVTPEDKTLRLRIGGIIDRMDQKNDTIRICDYKTGGKPKSTNFDEHLFNTDKTRSEHIFQTFLYASIIQGKNQVKPVKPELLYIHLAGSQHYSSDILIEFPGEQSAKRNSKQTVEDFKELKEAFDREIRQLIEEIFDPGRAFTQTEQLDRCSYCDFKNICGR